MCLHVVTLVLLIEWIYSSIFSIHSSCSFVRIIYILKQKLGIIRLSNIFHCQFVDLLTTIMSWSQKDLRKFSISAK